MNVMARLRRFMSVRHRLVLSTLVLALSTPGLALSTPVLALSSAVAAVESPRGQPQTAPLWPTERPPRPLAAPDVRFPPYEVRTLPNGLKVMVVLHHEQPAVSVRLLVRAGAAQDPAGKAGMARLLASLLDQGTTTRSATEIASTIDSIGGGLGTGASGDLTFASAVVMKDSFDLVMDLISDLVRHPAFSAEEIERQRQQTISAFQVSLNDPDYVAEMVFDRLVYGNGPYSLPESGTAETVARITRDDLVAFHDTFFVPNNTIVAVVGDLTSEEAFAGVERVFGDWEAGEILPREFEDAPPPTRRIVVIDRPDAVQTEIRAGHIAIPRRHPDYMAINLATKILGGEGSNRLHRVLRSERALTYGAAADLSTRRYGGDIEAETDTRTEATGEALRLIVDEFWRLQRERVGVNEIAGAQAYLTGHFPLTIETPIAIAQQIMNALFYELDLAELDTYRDRVNAVTVDDIQRVAMEYYKPDQMSIVMVGNASAFVDQLSALGFGEYELIPLAQLDLLSPTLGGTGAPHVTPAPEDDRATAPATDPANTAATDTSNDTARQAGLVVVRRAIAAKGGATRLASVETVKIRATSTLATPQGPVTATTVTYIEYPDRFRVEATLPVGEIVQGFADGDAWFSDPAGVHDAPPEMRADFDASVHRDLIRLLLQASAGELVVRVLPPIADADGQMLDGVEITGSSQTPIALYVDRESGLVVKQTYTLMGSDGLEPTEEEFFDYRLVDGLRVAFRAVVRRRGEMVIERVVHEFELNTPIDPELFKRPTD